MTRVHHQYLDGFITGLGMGTVAFGIATNRWWLSLIVFAFIAWYNASALRPR